MQGPSQPARTDEGAAGYEGLAGNAQGDRKEAFNWGELVVSCRRPDVGCGGEEDEKRRRDFSSSCPRPLTSSCSSIRQPRALFDVHRLAQLTSTYSRSRSIRHCAHPAQLLACPPCACRWSDLLLRQSLALLVQATSPQPTRSTLRTRTSSKMQRPGPARTSGLRWTRLLEACATLFLTIMGRLSCSAAR